MPAALSFTLLGGVESLLSAKVADSMTGRKHRSNMELVAQGIANIGSALFGGIAVTGTIARTATNVRAGARSPVSGMMHALFLLLFMLVAAPLAAYRAACRPGRRAGGGVLVHGGEKGIRRSAAPLAQRLGAADDLRADDFPGPTTGIIAGCVLAAVLAAFHRGVAEEGD